MNTQYIDYENEIIEKLSEDVSYIYQIDSNGFRANERLVTSSREFPGILHNSRFFSGLHANNRFNPGILWYGRFIPGLLTNNGFIPGIAVGKSFTPGIIVAGFFMPGIVQGNYFVPGIMQDRKFLMGCFTANQRFIPGRFIQNSFESGLLMDGSFQPMRNESISSEKAHHLAKNYGLETIRPFETIGGLPIRGLVLGNFNDILGWFPYGFATSQVVIPGGLNLQEDIKQSLRPPLHTVDIEQELGEMGFIIEDPTDIGTEFEDIEKWFIELYSGDFNGMDDGGILDGLASALDELGKGKNELIDGLNQEWEDWFESIRNSNPGGLIVGSGSKGSRGKGVSAEEIGGAIGAVIGVVGGYISGGPIGAVAGGLGGYDLGMYVVDKVGNIVETIWHTIFGGAEDKESSDKNDKESKDKEEKDKQERGATTGEDEDLDREQGFLPGSQVHPPLSIYINKKQTLIERDHGDIGFSAVDAPGAKAAFKIIRTDTGAMMVVDHNIMRKLLLGMTPGKASNVGLEACGNTIFIVHGAIFGHNLDDPDKLPWWLQPVAIPRP